MCCIHLFFGIRTIGTVYRNEVKFLRQDSFFRYE